MSAMLFREGAPPWRFTEGEYGRLEHITGRGTVYVIMIRPYRMGPFQVLRRTEEPNGIKWQNCIGRLKALYIEFDDGAQYWFPEGVKKRDRAVIALGGVQSVPSFLKSERNENDKDAATVVETRSGDTGNRCIRSARIGTGTAVGVGGSAANT